MFYKSLEQLKDNFFDEFKKRCDKFESELRNETPIDTGDMIRSWRTTNSYEKRIIINLMPYASIIARGRVFLRGRWYGSLKGWGVMGVKGLLKKHFKKF